jgi:hypothetical protein
MAFNIIEAKREHISLILHFIRQLAIYEKMESEVVATEAVFSKPSI